MSIAYYFKECPTCRNYNLSLVRDRDLRLRNKLGVGYQIVDERYIVALPDVWGEDAKKLAEQGAELPFLYDDVSNTFLNVDSKDDRAEMGEQIDAFFDACINYTTPEGNEKP